MGFQSALYLNQSDAERIRVSRRPSCVSKRFCRTSAQGRRFMSDVATARSCGVKNPLRWSWNTHDCNGEHLQIRSNFSANSLLKMSQGIWIRYICDVLDVLTRCSSRIPMGSRLSSYSSSSRPLWRPLWRPCSGAHMKSPATTGARLEDSLSTLLSSLA